MKVDPARIADFRNALAASGASALDLLDIEIFPGATIHSRRSVVACSFAGAALDSLNAAGAEAARLIGSRLGIDVDWGVHAGAGGRILLWIEYFPGGTNFASARVALQALQTALLAAAADESGEPPHRQAAERAVAAFDRMPVQEIFVQSTFLVTAARAADVPVHNVAGSSVAWQFGWGSRSELFFMTASLADSVPGHQLTWRKHFAKNLFREIGLPTPEWRVIAPDGDALRAAQQVGWPCAVKPVDRAFGEGVTAGISSPAELHAAVAIARRLSRKIIVEAHEPGADHRLMVLDGKLIGAVRRDPPAVTGDGTRSVEMLIAALNEGRDGTREAQYLQPVKSDPALAATLARQGLSMASVLPKGSRLALRSIANFSTGGSASEVTADVHPQIRGLAELLAVSLGLRTAGIDYITTDIARGHAEVGGGFIEVNAMPRLRVLMNDVHPEEEIAGLLLGQRPGRIPITLIIGDSDALAELAGPLRARVAAMPGSAAVSAQWAQIGATQLPAAWPEPFSAVTAVLRHLAVDELFILWTPDQIADLGVPADRLAKTIVIGQHEAGSALGEICPDIVAVADGTAALEAALGDR